MVKSLKAISYRGNYKKKTFFNKLLLATSSIGLLASMGGFTADIIPAGNPSSNTRYDE
ncbi:hypothetical protein [Rickettsia amblyommatis]|uniref:Uncharacterized protein n=1 Tax=Rickettsia amblyommatis str. Ac/Pa TaxID=1359164 RepID=A0A0F3N019_RICAM|nr:hypothetical protein [Rickettsia amblyommatis]KJV61378.1 hypothetical protein APHACPA_0383 [Rickettsia amblyommatis str. Ac/Pa]KJV97811.1 hypothetical protein RAMDARK_0162 [Rickettsia amblyommatis str. Darkwater]